MSRAGDSASVPMRAAFVGIPFVWLLVFVLLPVLIVLMISLVEARIGSPPYTPIYSPDEGLTATLGNFHTLISDELYFHAFLSSIRIAGTSALITLLIAYPMGYALARVRQSLRTPLVMLIMLPFWTPLLIRVYAWTGILNSNGLINNALMTWGVIDQPLPLLHNEFAVHLGIVYSYLPFMVLPIYAVLERFDWSLLEAASDLGAKPFRAFVRVTLPLSAPGILAGLLLVFIPAVGELIIPELLGGPGTLMIGRLLWTEFFNNNDWPLASALAIGILTLVLVPAAILVRQARRAEAAL
jgi:putrescine transport system permease protein